MKIIITEHQLRKLITEDYSPNIDFDGAKQFVSAMKSRGFSELESIALAGNVAQEVGGTFDPSITQLGGGPGRGLFQWEEGGNRFNALKKFAEFKGKSWTDKTTQYDFIRNELLNNYNDEGFKISDHLDFDNKYYTRLYENYIKPHKDLETLTSKISAIVFGCPSCGEGESSNTTRKDNSIKIKDNIIGVSDVSDNKSVEKKNIITDKPTVYPNPVIGDSKITIKYKTSAPLKTIKVKLMDHFANFIKEEEMNVSNYPTLATAGDHTFIFDLPSNIKAGIYYLSFIVNGKVDVLHSTKFIYKN
jgi:hypothetical protein